MRTARRRRAPGRPPYPLRPVFCTVYSIAIFTGASPFALAADDARRRNPVLTRDVVTDRFAMLVADPFMVPVDGTWHLFFEVVACRSFSKKGEIALATSRDGSEWTYRGVVLAEPFHLSYPCVFRCGSDYYMIPESTAAAAVRLYRGDPFPTRWALVSTLLRGPTHIDNSVFHHEGRWWMLTETDERRGTLRLFHSGEVTGPWVEHPRSPIVASDPRIARPAGRVISVDGRLIRFAQDCREVYGQSVSALEITRLNPSEYEEGPAAPNPVLAPSGRGWNRFGMHHIDAHQLADGSWIACVDGWANRVRRPREVAIWAADKARRYLARASARHPRRRTVPSPVPP